MRMEGKSPLLVIDRITPEGGYGWQYGWRHLDQTMECWRYTLPEVVFRALPKCPYQTEDGITPRWPTEQEAINALTEALEGLHLP